MGAYHPEFHSDLQEKLNKVHGYASVGAVVYMKVFFQAILLSLFFVPLFLWASIDEKVGVRVETWDYADPKLNEEAQVLPIPTRIHEIIYPTLGFPSLVFENDPFSIILQLSESQLKTLTAVSPNALR